MGLHTRNAADAIRCYFADHESALQATPPQRNVIHM